ncbi:hypothetical protein DN752_06025 [Echinicola strongylocentroti]|uniref:Response regulatory domain-containing protein n=1 Tax=Echinicola strongylocentroti TaxID=1795355 RepID=A0A2Z4IGK4_9BACT|nr:hypothetical protein [Echinicola strongylocentroti]AWW29716.1 hypothetical protein DN752_06025 [Echinicola strongylocentroti]
MMTNRINKPCNYFIIENDDDTKNKIQGMLDHGSFFCLGDSDTKVRVRKKLRACSTSLDIIILGLYDETYEIAKYVIANFPKASVILIVKGGETFENEWLGMERINYIVV